MAGSPPSEVPRMKLLSHWRHCQRSSSPDTSFDVQRATDRNTRVRVGPCVTTPFLSSRATLRVHVDSQPNARSVAGFRKAGEATMLIRPPSPPSSPVAPSEPSAITAPSKNMPPVTVLLIRISTPSVPMDLIMPEGALVILPLEINCMFPLLDPIGPEMLMPPRLSLSSETPPNPIISSFTVMVPAARTSRESDTTDLLNVTLPKARIPTTSETRISCNSTSLPPTTTDPLSEDILSLTSMFPLPAVVSVMSLKAKVFPRVIPPPNAISPEAKISILSAEIVIPSLSKDSVETVKARS